MDCSLIVWATITVLVALSCFISRYGQGENFELSEFINLAVAVASIVSSWNLLHLLITSQKLRNLLGTNHIITIFLGATAIIWVSFQQIYHLFK